jgi:quinol monooxygenase YgiN
MRASNSLERPATRKRFNDGAINFREVVEMPIQSNVISMRRSLLRFVPVMMLAALALAGQAFAQEPGSRDKIYVVTHADMIPTNLAAGKKLLQQYAMDSRKDKGCIRIEVMEQISRVNHHMIVEVWESQAAYDGHIAAAHTIEFRSQLDPMLGSPYDERLHHSLE